MSEYYPLTEERVVRELIRNRIKIDNTYAMKLYETDNPAVSNGVPPFDEDIICVYIDLDRVIERCGLSDMQMLVVKEMMKGYSAQDIGENCFEQVTQRQSINVQFNRAVEKISKYASAENDEYLKGKLKKVK